MTTTEKIEPGSKVRVTIEGEYIKLDSDGDHYVKVPNYGDEYYNDKYSTLTVLEPPLPPEPPLGSTVNHRYDRAAMFKRYTTGWYRLTDTSMHHGPEKTLTWGDVVKRVGRNYELLGNVRSLNDAVDLNQQSMVVTMVREGGYDTAKPSITYSALRDQFVWTNSFGTKFYIETSVGRELGLALVKATGGP